MLERIGAGIRDGPLSTRRGAVTFAFVKDAGAGLLSDDVDTLELRFDEGDFDVPRTTTSLSKWPFVLTQTVVKSSASPFLFFA